jgi:hypothetical protein
MNLLYVAPRMLRSIYGVVFSITEVLNNMKEYDSDNSRESPRGMLSDESD